MTQALAPHTTPNDMDLMTAAPTGRAALYRKIADVTAEIGRIPKNGRNSFHNYTYATESDITDALRDLLKTHGLAFLPPSVLEWQRDETVDNPKLGPRTRVLMQFELACCDTGEVYTAQLWGEGQDNSDKGFYKAYTGAVKYFLMKTFLIATGDDPERDDHQEPGQQRRPVQQPPRAPQTQQRPVATGATHPAPGERERRAELFAARKALGELPAVTKADMDAAADLDNLDLLRDLYREVKARKNGAAMETADLPL